MKLKTTEYERERLKAWREHGFPASRVLDIPETVAARVGVKLTAS